MSQIAVHEADEPSALIDLLEANALANECQAGVDLLPVEADTSASGNGHGLVVKRIVELS